MCANCKYHTGIVESHDESAIDCCASIPKMESRGQRPDNGDREMERDGDRETQRENEADDVAYDVDVFIWTLSV